MEYAVAGILLLRPVSHIQLVKDDVVGVHGADPHLPQKSPKIERGVPQLLQAHIIRTSNPLPEQGRGGDYRRHPIFRKVSHIGVGGEEVDYLDGSGVCQPQGFDDVIGGDAHLGGFAEYLDGGYVLIDLRKKGVALKREGRVSEDDIAGSPLQNLVGGVGIGHKTFIITYL